ncbi:hypothetical protein E2C01_040331 [Portunus trituberculatus]|uniref:Uncharacterized protein n=1 Tax=Portunus trituberculatus TaxID=210409 RepID=A0A5B7FNX6_PORTR|nr:hypothetical protein [Portunus trituberculatus]
MNGGVMFSPVLLKTIFWLPPPRLLQLASFACHSQRLFHHFLLPILSILCESHHCACLSHNANLNEKRKQHAERVNI